MPLFTPWSSCERNWGTHAGEIRTLSFRTKNRWFPERWCLWEGERERGKGGQFRGSLEGVQEIEKLQLIIFVPTSDQQAREVVLAQAHLRRLRHLRQTVRDGGWHATRRSLVQGVGQTAGGRRAAAGGVKSVKRRRRCRRRRCRRRRRGRRRGRGLPLDAPGPLRERGTAPGPFALLHPLEIQLPEATLARLVLGTRQLHEALVQREIVPDRVLPQWKIRLLSALNGGTEERRRVKGFKVGEQVKSETN